MSCGLLNVNSNIRQEIDFIVSFPNINDTNYQLFRTYFPELSHYNDKTIQELIHQTKNSMYGCGIPPKLKQLKLDSICTTALDNFHLAQTRLLILPLD